MYDVVVITISIILFNMLYLMYSFSVILSETMRNRMILLRMAREMFEHDDSNFENYQESILSNSDTSSLISKELIRYTKIKMSQAQNFCIVCQHNIDNEIVRELECCHSYHINCIDTWLSENDFCPMCRLPVSPKY